MQFLTYLTAVVALLASTVSAIQLKGPLTKVPVGPITFSPAAENPWSFDPAVADKVFLNGVIHVPGQGAPVPYALPVTALTKQVVGGKRNLRGNGNDRTLQDAGVICTLASITIGATDINIAGLDVNIPDPINIDVLGKAGLLGELLCGLLGPSGTILDILNNLVTLGAVGDILAGLQTLVQSLNAAA
jgi:hypothetical protein